MKRFTLIELLIVLTVITILSSMLLPCLLRAQGLAQKSECASNLRQLGMAFLMYANDNKMRLPPYSANRLQHGGTNWAFYILEYYGDVKVLDCPVSPDGPPEATHEALHLYDGNYGWNYSGTYAGRGTISSFGSSSKCYLVFDSGDQCVMYGSNNWTNLMEELDLDWDCGAEGANRHAGQVNVAYLDGHVEAHSIWDFVSAPCKSFEMPWNIEWENGMLEKGNIPFPIR